MKQLIHPPIYQILVITYYLNITYYLIIPPNLLLFEYLDPEMKSLHRSSPY